MVHNLMSDQPQEDKPEKTNDSAEMDTTRTTPMGKDANAPYTTTAVLSTRQLQRHVGRGADTSDLSPRDDREIILVIRGIIERFVVPSDRKITLGRADVKMRYVPDIDLTPYGALDRGVSREHARIWVDDGNLFISDNNSTNGTYIGGERLPAEAPTRLNKGDELMLGRLAIQILFR